MRLPLTLTLIFAGTLSACVYGILHDQITYTISEEFYTKIRFAQNEIPQSESWWGVTKVAVLNTWKIGLIISFTLSCMGLIHPTNKAFVKYTMQAFFISMGVAAILTALGYVNGIYNHNALEKLPNTIINKNDFLLVQSIHNFTYIGGLIGMFVGIYWQFYKRKLTKTEF